MKSTKQVDPELHLLRSAVRQIQDPRARSDAEGARFNLFAAFEARDPNLARRWAGALRMALTGHLVEDADTADLAIGALDTIDDAIGGAS